MAPLKGSAVAVGRSVLGKNVCSGGEENPFLPIFRHGAICNVHDKPFRLLAGRFTRDA